ncbi:MAG: thiamine phosphate synthase [Bacteroides sp.]
MDNMNKQQLIERCGQLQFISHYTERYSYLDSIRMALEGGCRWIQLRVKGETDDALRPMAIEALRLCREHGAVCIIDDRVELVKELDAHGVHLGKNDMPVAEARALLGKEYIIGGTANTFEDICHLIRQGADYIGCGPFRFTTTKEKLSPLLGAEGYRRLLQAMHEQQITTPLVAIGGITLDDLPTLSACGVRGIAISGSILRAPNPVEAMQRFVQALQTLHATS